jgi:hypothetical protein
VWRSCPDRLRPVRNTDGRNPDDVRGGKPNVGSNATLVDPDLAASKDSIDVALGNALQHSQQEIVDSLARAFFVDGDPRYAVLA